MKKLFLVFAAAMFVASSAWALTMCYSWEDGQTTLGQTPTTGFTCTNVTSIAHTGTHSLELVRTSSSTPQAWVAWVKGLTTGDVVSAQIYAYDTTIGGNPSGRIWAHYASGTNVNPGYGSASGPADYSGYVAGWTTVPGELQAPPFSWTFGTPAPTNPAADALVIEIRTYGTTVGSNTVWVDDITITAPDRAGVEIVFPGVGGPSAVDATTWGGIKALFN